MGKRRNFEMELKILWMNMVEPASKPHRTMAPARVVDIKQKATGNPVDIRKSRLPKIRIKASMVLSSIGFFRYALSDELASFNHAIITSS